MIELIYNNKSDLFNEWKERESLVKGKRPVWLSFFYLVSFLIVSNLARLSPALTTRSIKSFHLVT